MATNESCVFGGVELNDFTNFRIQAFDPGIAPKRWNWIQGADSDGSLAVEESHFDNAEMTVRVRVTQQANMDAALTKIGTLIDAIQEAEKNPLGSPVVWTPAGSTKSLTGYVLGGEVTGLPIELSGDDAGWFVRAPVLTIKFYRRPFWYGAEVTTITDNFSTDSIGAGTWAFDTGAGTLSVSGGQLVPSTTATKRLYYTPSQFYDVQFTYKFTTGASVAGTIFQEIILKRLSSSDYLEVYHSSGSLGFQKVVGGVGTGIAFDSTSGTFVVSTNTSYWLRVRIEGNLLTAELWSSAPTATGSPIGTSTVTLTGATATTFGAGVKGYVGMMLTAPATDYRYDDVEIAPNTWKSTDPLITGSIPGVSGDVPAEGRLVITDSATQSRNHVEWGLQQRYYDSATSLILDSDSLVTSGFGGTGTTRSGAYDPGAAGNSVVRGTLTTSSPVAICGTGNLAHVGTYRVKARVYASATTNTSTRVRLSWKEGDGSLRSNDYVTPSTGAGWSEVDLGLITIPEKTLGTQRWTGQIEAYTTSAAGDTLDVDYLMFIPTDAYGKGRVTQGFETVTAFVARDEFDQTAGALAAKTLPAGGTWAGAGDADDFSVETSGKTAQRTAVSDADIYTGRFAIAGTTVQAATVVQVDAKTSFAAGGVMAAGVFARYTDTSNYMAATWNLSGGISVRVWKKVAGVATDLITLEAFTAALSTYYSSRLVVDAAGRWYFWVWPSSSTPPSVPTCSGVDSVLATGGTLASGKFGMYDAWTTATAGTRNFNNFIAGVPAVDAVVFSGRAAEIRHDSAIRQDSTGTYYGPVQSYRGSRFLLPPAGSAARTARLGVKVRRNDIDTQTDDQIADSTTVAVKYTPRYLVVPR